MSLVPCVGCGRHVQTTDPRCPFCGAAVDPSRAPQDDGRVALRTVYGAPPVLRAAAGCSAVGLVLAVLLVVAGTVGLVAWLLR